MPSEICLLSSENEKSVWAGFMDRLPLDRRDLHYSLAYADIYKDTYATEPVAIYFKKGTLEVIQPIVLKAIDDLPFLDDSNSLDTQYDIESPYGFGGPLFNRKPTAEETFEFYEKKRVLFEENSVVTEFCSYHPLFPENQYHGTLKDAGVDVCARKSCAYIDLTAASIDIWCGIEERQRKAIASARKRNVVVKKEVISDSVLAQFHEQYIETMSRLHAEDSWFFPDDYFENCFRCLGEGSVSLFNAYYEAEVVASFFLIHEFNCCYYHFSSSNPDYASLNANHLLMFDTCLWAKQRGYRYYFLGGGFSKNGDDSLYKFKQSFSEKTCNLIQSSAIYNNDVYELLNQKKKKYDLENKNVPKPNSFFPYYRS